MVAMVLVFEEREVSGNKVADDDVDESVLEVVGVVVLFLPPSVLLDFIL